MRIGTILATLLLSHPSFVKPEGEEDGDDDAGGDELDDYDYELLTDEELLVPADLEGVVCPQLLCEGAGQPEPAGSINFDKDVFNNSMCFQMSPEDDPQYQMHASRCRFSSEATVEREKGPLYCPFEL